MHSSGMRTARFLTVSQHALGRGCVCPGWCLPGGLPSILGRHPLGRLGRHPPLDRPSRHILGRHPPDKHPPGQTSPPSRRLLQWTVRILLECIVVVLSN